MLPRLETFKQAMFNPRLTTYNESFVPLNSLQKEHKPIAVLWHEAIDGRKKEQIISAYYQFLLENRDIKHMVLWVEILFEILYTV